MSSGSATFAASLPAHAEHARAIPGRVLIPREHGAYGQLAFPLVTALALTRWTPAGLALTGAAVALFFAHEPVLVMLGHRGVRAQREHSERAWSLLLGLVAIAGALGGIGVALSPLAAQVAVVGPLLLAATLGWMLARKAEKTTAGELLAAWTLSLAALPIMIANGASPVFASAVCGVWVTGFSIATLTVRGLIAHQKARACAGFITSVACTAVISLGMAMGAAAYELVPRLASLSVLPMGLLCVLLVATRPSTRHLREIGWAIVGSCVLTAATLIATVV